MTQYLLSSGKQSKGFGISRSGISNVSFDKSSFDKNGFSAALIKTALVKLMTKNKNDNALGPALILKIVIEIR